MTPIQRVIRFVFFVLFASPFVFVAVIMFGKFQERVEEMAGATRLTANVTQIRDLSFPYGKYEVEIYDRAGSMIRTNVAKSLDLMDVHDLGEEVSLAVMDDELEIINTRSEFLLSMLWVLVSTLVLYIVSLSLFSQPTRIHKLAARMIFFLIGSMIFLISLYHLRRQQTFDKYSVSTTAVVTGYKVNTCESTDDDGTTTSYRCYSRQFAYQAQDGNDYSYTEKARKRRKKDPIGKEVTLYYLEDSPSSAQVMPSRQSKFISLLVMGFGMIFILGSASKWKSRSDK